jgi:hypothetical protein
MGRPEEGSNPALYDLESCLRVSLAPPSSSSTSEDGAEASPSPLSYDPFLLYLFGIVLLARKKVKEGREALLRSIEIYPCNWQAWQVRLGKITSILTHHVVIDERC